MHSYEANYEKNLNNIRFFNWIQVMISTITSAFRSSLITGKVAFSERLLWISYCIQVFGVMGAQFIVQNLFKTLPITSFYAFWPIKLVESYTRGELEVKNCTNSTFFTKKQQNNHLVFD